MSERGSLFIESLRSTTTRLDDKVVSPYAQKATSGGSLRNSMLASLPALNLTYLSPRHGTFHNVLILARHLRFNILLQPPKNKRTDDTVQPSDQLLASFGTSVDDAVHGVGEPIRELLPRSKHVWHEKVEQ